MFKILSNNFGKMRKKSESMIIPCLGKTRSQKHTCFVVKRLTAIHIATFKSWRVGVYFFVENLGTGVIALDRTRRDIDLCVACMMALSNFLQPLTIQQGIICTTYEHSKHHINLNNGEQSLPMGAYGCY